MENISFIIPICKVFVSCPAGDRECLIPCGSRGGDSGSFCTGRTEKLFTSERDYSSYRSYEIPHGASGYLCFHGSTGFISWTDNFLASGKSIFGIDELFPGLDSVFSTDNCFDAGGNRAEFSAY